MTLIECIPNFSEGRRQDVIDEIAAAVVGVDGVHLLDVQSDATHNRCVVTFVGHQGPIAEAAFRAIETAAALIDLNRHEGAHPRFGAADVVPFVPLRAEDTPVCIDTAQHLARRVATDLEIPAFLYEDAARIPEHKNLAVIRGKGFEEMREVIGSEPAKTPDEGEARVHATAGAVAIGARFPLIAFNVNLDSGDLDLARRIAVEIRERDGGMKCVKAMGLQLDSGTVQVSMNLTDYRVTSMADVVAAIGERASAAGVAIRESEVVGLLPQDALVRLAQAALSAHGFTRAQVLEAQILDTLL
ncbi:MAG TPA: glutamate formimidoyltransferase [Thermoleophilia bacterium]|nr:glutamate formimidoyltransferase [Thermoleophilia bacterium]